MIPKNDSNLLNNISKLRWACRRGMLELDVLLSNFLNEAYPALSDEEKQIFIELLSCTDPELFAWFLGSEVPADANLAMMAEKVRLHARSRVKS